MDSISPNTSNVSIEQMLQDALSHIQSGRLQEAESLYQQILYRKPDHPHALHLLGLLKRQAGDLSRAVELLERAVAAKPDFADAFKNLANIYAELNQLDHAIENYQRAIKISPELVEAHYNLATLFEHQNRLEDAIRHYQRTLVVKPGLVEASNRLRRILHDAARAIESNWEIVNQPATLSPQQQAQEFYDKAVSSQSMGKINEAINFYRQAIEAKPDSHMAYNNLGLFLAQQGRLEEALVCHLNVVALKPENFIGYSNCGMALNLLNRYEDAALCLEKAIKLDGNNAQLHCNLGQVLLKLVKLEDAAAHCERALQLQPMHIDARLTLASIRSGQGRVREGIDYRDQVLKQKPSHLVAGVAQILDMHYLSDFSPYDLFTAAKKLVSQHAPKELCLLPPSNDSTPSRRLRIGYVSGDFRNHPVGYFLKSVLSNHNKVHFQVFCYSNGHNSVDDELTNYLQKQSDCWREISWWSDIDVAKLIRQDGIDILIDLSGHTNKSRILAFAHKPAPVQATWMGYFDTTGLPQMDYILADRYVIPPKEERFYVEKVMRLPNSYLCFSPPEIAIEISALPSTSRGHITFGCFHKPSKLSEQTISCWSKLLHALPTSEIILKYEQFGDAGVRNRFHSLFADQGINRERIKMLGQSPRHKLLANYNDIDIALDPYPYNGGTSTLEALWMGVPVVTLSSDRFVSHVGESILANIGLSECVTNTEDAYIAKALSLAEDLPYLAELRKQLRSRLLDSPLCDGPGFTRDLEGVYRTMWRAWCQSE